MPLTEFQRLVCRILARGRVARGEQYVAGGAALNELLPAARQSRDVDLFHDTQEALLAAWQADRAELEHHGFAVRVIREYATFVEAEIIRGADGVLLQWVQDSAYRFFPLVEHPDFGLALHPFDLATNKVLALVGRVEVRDWVDAISCHDRLQPFGFLVWAACGKDPGLTPAFILNQARRSAHYSRAEIESLAFAGAAPDPVALGATWRSLLTAAAATVTALPEDTIGCCVLQQDGRLFAGDADDIPSALAGGRLLFHRGTIRGAWPRIAGRNG
jgi:hypothetical protein